MTLRPFAHGCFLTGTDTEVGKTYVASLLVRALRAQNIDAVPMKPICCGERTDAESLEAACEQRISLNALNPVWLRTPAAPYTAAMIENRPIDLALIGESYAALRRAHPCVVVEGIGGWRVPITQDFFVSDLAAQFALPIVLVVGNKLGALNHALLTVEAIQARGLHCAGVILNDCCQTPAPIAAATNASVLESLLSVPLLAEIRHGQRELQLKS